MPDRTQGHRLKAAFTKTIVSAATPSRIHVADRVAHSNPSPVSGRDARNPPMMTTRTRSSHESSDRTSVRDPRISSGLTSVMCRAPANAIALTGILNHDSRRSCSRKCSFSNRKSAAPSQSTRKSAQTNNPDRQTWSPSFQLTSKYDSYGANHELAASLARMRQKAIKIITPLWNVTAIEGRGASARPNGGIPMI